MVFCWLLNLSAGVGKIMKLKLFFTKLGWRMGCCPDETADTVGVDLDMGMDKKSFSNLQSRAFFSSGS